MIRLRQYFVPLAAVILFLSLGWAGGPDNRGDRWMVASLVGVRQALPETEWIAAGLTHIGSIFGTFGIVLAGAIWLAFRRRYGRALLLVGAMVAERLAMDGLKLVYQRPRPSFDDHPVVISSFSFPSGHSSNSMTAFVLFALLAVPAERRATALAILLPLAVAIGLTRPFLGVHWPSDVLGGWCLAALTIWVAMKVEPRVSRAPA